MKRAAQKPIFWVIATLVVALLPQVAVMPPLLAATTLVPVGWRIAAELRGWKPAHIVVRVLATAVSVYLLLLSYGSLMGRRAAVSLLALMLTLKLLETFKVRDARVVTSFSLFLCATQFLFLQNLSMVIYGTASVILALVAMALLNRAQSFAPTGREPAGATGLLGELGFSARLLAIAVPFGLVLFLFFPRWGSPLWGVPEETLDAKSGLSDAMTPGSIQSLFMDDTPAFRAQFETATPSQSELYWRGPVFWNFDGTTWTSSFIGRNVQAETRPEIRTAPWRYAVQLEPNERRWLFALDYPAIVPQGVRLTMDYQLYSARAITQVREYQMLSNPDFTDSPNLLSTIRSEALRLPDGFNPRTRELVKRWRLDTPGDAAFVRRVLQFFRTENFHYTLNPETLSQHTVDEFVFDTRQGFCEHYASAFTVMMRMAGIPARIVTGYQGGWFNDFGRYVLVRQSDAHAWSEVWLEGTGWTRIDPTAAVAPDRIEQNALDALGSRRYTLDFAWVRGLRNGFDLLGRWWNDSLVTFNAMRQTRLLERFGLGRMGSRGLVVVLVASLAAVASVLIPLILRLRAAERPDRAARLWRRFRRQLQAAGVATFDSQGPLETAAQACAQLAARHEEIRTVTDLYLRLRYAENAPDFRQLERAVRQFEIAK